MEQQNFQIGKEIFNNWLSRFCKPTSVKNGFVNVKYTYTTKYSNKTRFFFRKYTISEFNKMVG